MKISKRQLRRIIKEEKVQILESMDMTNASRAIGMYFDVNLVEKAEDSVADLYHAAIEAAFEDGLEIAEARAMVNSGIHQWLNENMTILMGGN
jgi:hypothetical protein